MINTMFMDKMAPGILRLSVMDNDIDLFEGQYPVPNGVSYNSYLIEDERLCLLDTVDARKQERIRATAALWLETHETALQPRFDVVEVYAPDGIHTKAPEIRLIEDAF